MVKKLYLCFLFFLTKLAYGVNVTSIVGYIESEEQKEYVRQIIMTTSGPYAQTMCICGLIVAAGAWQFGEHIKGMRMLAGCFAGMIIIANLPTWIEQMTGAVI